jgi:L-lysine 6-transaminase
MVRSTKYLEIIEEENLVDNAFEMGGVLINSLFDIGEEFPSIVSGIRGRGLFCAFDLASADIRKKFLDECFEEGLIILPCGARSIRFRPALNITEGDLNDGFEIVRNVLKKLSIN